MINIVDANQLSPRLSFTYKPFETPRSMPAMRATSRRRCWWRPPRPTRLFNNTDGAAPAGQNDPVLPERSNYFDAGVDQKIYRDARGTCELDLGVDAYYKIATDLIDNGLFGQAYVLSAFNYARG